MEPATKRIGKANTHHRMRLAIYGDYSYTMSRRMIYTLQQICASLQGGGVMAAAAAKAETLLATMTNLTTYCVTDSFHGDETNVNISINSHIFSHRPIKFIFSWRKLIYFRIARAYHVEIIISSW